MRYSKFSLCLAILWSSAATNLHGQASPAPTTDSGHRTPANMGSTYVPLDSWIYPAMERLAALGYVQTDFLGQRPWTRMECARLLNEADDRAAENSGTEASVLYTSLRAEFALELRRDDGASN